MGLTSRMPLASLAARALRWPAWTRLPRDARDTLFLLVVIGWTIVPHVPYLPGWCTGLAATVLVWRGAIALRHATLPPRWVVLAVLVMAAGLTFWSHRTLLGREAGITLVVAMMTLKTLELRARRDAFVVFFLGFFLVLTQFLNSQSLLVALAMVVAVWGLLTGLVLAHMPVGQPSLRQAALLSARVAGLGLPVMALLFVLFPRMGPLWGVPGDAGARTGLSSTLEMGTVAQLALDDSVALRVRFGGASPPPQALYFRGPVLGAFDGRQWKRLEPRSAWSTRPRAELEELGPPLRYEMTLEPQRTTVLPLLEATPAIETAMSLDTLRATRRDDLQWQADRPITQRLRFEATAHVDFRHGPTLPVPGLAEYQALPEGFNPRTLAWAASLRQEPAFADADARTLARAVLAHIAKTGFSYTLEPGNYGDGTGRHAVDEFWLDRKQGFCEHFASAFVVVMRALGVPARIVTGYQGADLEPVDGYLVVRNSNAHAWAEYWQPGAGWLRADPTAAVAPERIGLGRSLVPRPGLVAQALEGVSPTLLFDLRRVFEAMDNRWNQWVLNYSRGEQLDLLKRLGFDMPRWEHLAYLLMGAVSCFGLGVALWAWWDRRRETPWGREIRHVREALHAVGVETLAHHAPRELARRLRARHPGDGEAAARLLDELDAGRYGREAGRPRGGAWRRAWHSEMRALRRASIRSTTPLAKEVFQR